MSSRLSGLILITDHLQAAYERYVGEYSACESVGQKNQAQHTLRESFDSFFASLHQGLKDLGRVVRHQEKEQAAAGKKANKKAIVDRKTKELKVALEKLHAGVKEAEGFFKHIHWLQERFPQAEYEDVAGLCKLASLEEVKEQSYSLNPGRYVGVVIEEDDKTEEEFVEELLAIPMNNEFEALNADARSLEDIISANIRQITGEV